MPLLSAVVPCFNEEESLPLFAEEFSRVAKSMGQNHPDLEFELILVDDGSSDSTLPLMKELASSDEFDFRVVWLSFSRNFGKESALYAGLSHASGDFVATMDADMQDPPSMLPEMYELLLEGEYDNVATRRVTREGEPIIRSFFARKFYQIINKISNVDIVDGARDFRLMNRTMVDAIISLKEYNRFSKGIYGWVGFKTKWLPYVNVNRVAGETKWSFFSLLIYALDGVVAFSTTPLSIASIAGLLLCLLSVVLIVLVVARTLIFGDPVTGWPSLVCIIVFIGGLQLFCLGIIGQYLSKTYLETKGRPIYVLKDSNDRFK